MPNPLRKRLYRQALRDAQWRPSRRLIRYHIGPGEMELGNGAKCGFLAATLTVPIDARRIPCHPPELRCVGPLTETWPCT